jgi:nucleoside-diphosphate-sugar epimerase
MIILVTGSSGLIGSEAVEHFDREGHQVIGIDNNMRREFFGPPGDTLWNLERLRKLPGISLTHPSTSAIALASTVYSDDTILI